jgi:hypothetical protein
MPPPVPTPSRFHSWLFTKPDYAAFFAAVGAETVAACAEVGRQLGHEVARGNHVNVWRTPLTAAGRSETFYIKRYTCDDAPLRYWGRPSRAWNEYRNYLVWNELGIEGPEAVMGGETRSWRGLHQALVVTREIPRCRALAELMGDPAFARDAAVRRHILAQLGSFAGMAHRRAFFHRDLKLRNILVQDFPAPDCKVFWIDCPKGGFCPRGALFRLRRAHLAAADLADMESLRGALAAGEWAELRAAYAAALQGG